MFYEIQKVFDIRSVKILLAVLLASNAVICLFSTSKNKNHSANAISDDVYQQRIENILVQADANLDAFKITGIASDTFVYRYQIASKDTYSFILPKVNLKEENVRGWDTYFSYDSVNIFIFLALTIISTSVFAQEKNSGFFGILRTSRYGRTKTALSKIAAMMLMTVGIVLLFTLETWIIVGLQLGYSSPSNAIQAFDAYILCPYAITIGEYFLITISVKCTTCILFSTVIMAISVFVYNYAIIYICGIGFFGVNFLLYTLHYLNSDNPLKNLNLVATAAVTPLFARYRAINLFSYVIDYVPFMCVFFTVTILTGSVLTVWKYNSGAEIISLRWLSSFKKSMHAFRFPETLSQHSTLRCKIPSLLYIETYKTLISSRYLWLILILLFVKCYIANINFQPPESFSDAVYKEYMTTLSGEISNEKRQYLTEENERIQSSLNQYPLMLKAYEKKEITFEEYRRYLSEYEYAYNRETYINIINNHVSYIDRLAAEGREAWFIYDTGWKTLFYTAFDWTLYAALLLLFAGIFAKEYDHKSSSGRFAQILRTTKNGRRKTYQSKYLSSAVLAVLITIVWNAVDFIWILNAYELPMLNAPLWSIEAFENFAVDITILQYLVCLYSVRLLASALLTHMICSLSAILRKSISVMTVAVALTLFPALLEYFGLSVFAKADFTALMRATPMLLQDNILVVYSTVVLAVCILTAVRAEREWNT